LLNFKIKDIVKNIYLEKDDSKFKCNTEFKLDNLSPKLFIKKIKKSITNTSGQVEEIEKFEISKQNDEEESYKELTKEIFLENFEDMIEDVISKYEPSVSYWKPSEKYLISEEDLNEFSKDIDKKKVLNNIFLLAGYDSEEKIKDVILNIPNGTQRSKLISKLKDELDKYIKDIWKHDIDVVIDITETGKFTLSIKDSGEKNKHDRLPISGRSEGARHFLSLILSLSIENSEGKRENQLILIDEPEAHLHPSGIRNLRDELLKIGEKNFLFIATHSPFLIDRKNKERNIILKKDALAFTKKIEINKYTNIIDDEVLREAFGIEVYRDLLNPHSILVEGASDKNILSKAFELDKKKYGITNGHGSNIVALSSKLNYANISILVMLDDDKDGKKYREDIIKIKGAYSADNVLTIRDMVGEIKDGGTIEDVLGSKFVTSQFFVFYKEKFNLDLESFVLTEDKSYIEQIKIFLQKEKKYNKELIEEFKIKISENFEPKKSSFNENFPLLKKIIEEIEKKLN